MAFIRAFLGNFQVSLIPKLLAFFWTSASRIFLTSLNIKSLPQVAPVALGLRDEFADLVLAVQAKRRMQRN